MSLPFRPLPHRLRPADVFPVQLANRLGERLTDARALVSRQHRPDDPDGGVHRLIGQPIASRLFAAPAGNDEWGDAPPVWSYGPWDGKAVWGDGGPVNQVPGTPTLEHYREIVMKFANPLQDYWYRGRVLIEMNPAVSNESMLVLAAAWHPSRNEFQFRIPETVMPGVRLICVQVF